MPLTEFTHKRTFNDTDTLVAEESTTRKLYTLEELRDGKHIEDERSDIVTSGVSQAYQTALEKLAEWNTDYEWWDTDLDQIAEVFNACGFTYNSGNVEFDLDRGSKFVLPRDTDVDTQAFLKALKIYLSGVDVRVPLLEYGATEGNRPNAIRATGTQIRKLDLRSKDVRIAKEQGFKVYVVNSNWGSRSDEFDFDYHYDDPDLSERFKEDANEFLSDLCAYALRSLRGEYEYRSGDEALLEMAEANEYRFTKEGRIA